VKEKEDIRSLSFEELKAFFVSQGNKPLQAKQVDEWLWKKAARSFEEMHTLTTETREFLDKYFVINAVKLDQFQTSNDGTIKNAFRLHDGNIVEGVLIPSPKRITACISTQAGCSLTCTFCGTGKLKMLRNLNADEIFDQVALIANQAEEKYGMPLRNVVYMGMGEPLLNYKNMLESVERITFQPGLGIAAQRITVSTAGIAKMIKKLGDDKVKFNLALSLHAANDEKRNKIMPINEQNSLDVLTEALNYFSDKTGKRVMLEYIVFKDFNDTIKDADELLEFSRRTPSKINIIEYNPIEGGELQQTTQERHKAFADHLLKNAAFVTVRKSRGKDIDAACGQLANRNESGMEQRKLKV
jgi:23S rRNA (adenine2503-C2)-methyltransferase